MSVVVKAAKTVVLLAIVLAVTTVAYSVDRMAERKDAGSVEMKVAKMALLKVAMTAVCSVDS